MLSIDKLIPSGRGLAPALTRRAPTVTLDWDTRQKSRFDATDSLGRAFGVSLARGSVVRGGDVLVAEDGSLVRVIATPQPVLVVRASADGSPFDLLRAAYHLGKRQVALELQADRLQLAPDHLLADLLRQMHLVVSEEQAPFEPEGGAHVAHAGSRAHAHAPAAAPAGHGHAHGHAQDHAHGHVHGPHCGHDRH